MSALLTILLLVVQGIPVQQTGTVTGVLRNADGKPAQGVRVSAVPQTDSLEETAAGPTLSSIAETDANGRYKLENVPPGRYYIAAGRLDLPTYYPGTPSMAVGRPVLVSAGLTVSDIDFVMNANSAGRAEPLNGIAGGGIVLLDLPLDVRVEGGGKLPVLDGIKRITVQLTPVTGTAAPVSAGVAETRISIAPPVTDYRVSVENLPEGYAVKSVKSNSTELTDRVLRITSIAQANTYIVSTSSGGQVAYLNVVAAAAAQRPALVITLGSSSPAAATNTGVRVTGSLPSKIIRGIYLGGAPGIVFSDSTFEFRNVPAGRHLIATRNDPPSSRPLVASVVVGANDLNGVEVVSTPVLPSNVRALSAGLPATASTPGALSLPSLRGRILDAETGQPVSGGTVFLVGDSFAGIELRTGGEFKFEKLLPGNYEIEVQGLGYPTFRRAVVIKEEDVDIEMKAG